MRKPIVAIAFISIMALAVVPTVAQTNSDRLKLETQLRVYGDEGRHLYTVSFLPLAPSSISEKRLSFLNQLLSFPKESEKIGFLFKIKTPKESEGGKLDLQYLTLVAKSAEWNLSGEVYRMVSSDFPANELKIEKDSTFTGVYAPYDPDLIQLMEKETDMYIYYKNYKGAGPRAKLKLPEDFFQLK